MLMPDQAAKSTSRPRPTSAAGGRAQAHARREEQAGERDERSRAERDLEAGLVLERGRPLREERPRDEAREARRRAWRRLPGARAPPAPGGRARAHCAQSPGGGGRYPRSVRLRRLITFLVALALLAFPAGAMADDFQQIFGDYKSDGQIDSCYRPDQIHNAGQSIPPDIEQYAPGSGTRSRRLRPSAGRAAAGRRAREGEEPALVSAGSRRRPRHQEEEGGHEPPAPDVAPTAVSAELAAPRLPAAAAVRTTRRGR